MSFALSVAVYFIIWWTVLFAVLPLWTRPVTDPEEKTHFRGAPERPLLLRKVLVTTLVSGIVWLGIWAVIESGWISFRDGF